MNKRLEVAVEELEAMAGEGNRHAVQVLRTIAEETRDRFDYAELRAAVVRARRAYHHFTDDGRDEAEAVKYVRLDSVNRDANFCVN